MAFNLIYNTTSTNCWLEKTQGEFNPVGTTDATPTLVGTITVPDNHMFFTKGKYIFRDQNTLIKGGGGSFESMFMKDTGSVQRVNSTRSAALTATTKDNIGGTTRPLIDLVANGSVVEFWVTGLAARNFVWYIEGEYCIEN